MEVSDAKRLHGLEDENRRLKQLVAGLSLDKEAFRAYFRRGGRLMEADTSAQQHGAMRREEMRS